MSPTAGQIKGNPEEAAHYIEQLLAENEAMRAALKAQADADDAADARSGYEQWQALEDKAAEMRRKILGA